MEVGNLIKFIHAVKPEENDIGIILSIVERDITLHWAKSGFATSTIDRLLSHADRFEVIYESR